MLTTLSVNQINHRRPMTYTYTVLVETLNHAQSTSIRSARTLRSSSVHNFNLFSLNSLNSYDREVSSE